MSRTLGSGLSSRLVSAKSRRVSLHAHEVTEIASHPMSSKTSGTQRTSIASDPAQRSRRATRDAMLRAPRPLQVKTQRPATEFEAQERSYETRLDHCDTAQTPGRDGLRHSQSITLRCGAGLSKESFGVLHYRMVPDGSSFIGSEQLDGSTRTSRRERLGRSTTSCYIRSAIRSTLRSPSSISFAMVSLIVPLLLIQSVIADRIPLRLRERDGADLHKRGNGVV